MAVKTERERENLPIANPALYHTATTVLYSPFP